MTKKEYLRITKELSDKIIRNRVKMKTATLKEKSAIILENHEMMVRLDKIYATCR